VTGAKGALSSLAVAPQGSSVPFDRFPVNALAWEPVDGDHGAMLPAEKQTWLDDLTVSEPGSSVDQAWLQWLGQLYDERGALPPEAVQDLAEDATRQRAQSAGALVALDVWHSLAETIEVSTTVDPPPVRLVVNGEWVNGTGVMSFAPDELLVEVAGDIQEVVMDDSRVWPECPQHGAGLHPESDNGTPSWVCRVGDHVVAPIGELGAAGSRSPRARKRFERRRNRR
jgi:hypothetical protein